MKTEALCLCGHLRSQHAQSPATTHCSLCGTCTAFVKVGTSGTEDGYCQCKEMQGNETRACCPSCGHVVFHKVSVPPIKALSLLQPWASLVAVGAKKIETRSWNTRYRGRLAIHASVGFPAWNRQLFNLREVKGALAPFHRTYLTLPLGEIIATCNLVATKKIDYFDWRITHEGSLIPKEWAYSGERWNATEQELAFGDFRTGRYMWFLSDLELLATPIPCKGRLGLWDWGFNQNG